MIDDLTPDLHQCRACRGWRERIDQLIASVAIRDEELLRVRTTQQAAAHALDNLCVEFGLGAGVPPSEAADKIRGLLKKAEAVCNEYRTSAIGIEASNRLRHILRDANIQTYGDVQYVTRRALGGMRGMGQTSLLELDRLLRERFLWYLPENERAGGAFGVCHDSNEARPIDNEVWK